MATALVRLLSPNALLLHGNSSVLEQLGEPYEGGIRMSVDGTVERAIREPYDHLYCLLDVLYDGTNVRLADDESRRFLGFTRRDEIQRQFKRNVLHRCSAEPFEHQIVGANYILHNPSSLLFWETGTGKSLALMLALDFLIWQGEVKSALLVMPNSLLPNWYHRHLRRFYPQYTYHHDPQEPLVPDKVNVIPLWSTLTVSSRVELLQQYSGWQGAPVILLVNYDTFSRAHKMPKLHYDFVAFDECHMLKNGSHRTRSIITNLSANRCVGLTGTPSDGKFIDYFNQFRAVGVREPMFCRNVTQFRERYTRPSYIVGQILYRNVYAMLRYIDANSYQLEKENCITLPEKIYTEELVPLSPAHAKEYRTFVETLIPPAWLRPEGKQADTSNRLLNNLSRITFARMLVGTKPENAKLQWLEENLHDGEKYVIFAWFRSSIQLILNKLRHLKPAAITGDTDPDRRFRLVRDFMETDDPNVLVVQPMAAGYGLDLQAARTAIFYESDFSYILRKQAEDRIHRIGQKDKVQIIDLIAPGTVDEAIAQALREKYDITSALTVASDEDVREILGGYYGR